MDILLALLGVAVGFLLSCAWQLMRQRRTATRTLQETEAGNLEPVQITAFRALFRQVDKAEGRDGPHGSNPFPTRPPSPADKELR